MNNPGQNSALEYSAGVNTEPPHYEALGIWILSSHTLAIQLKCCSQLTICFNI